MIPKAHHFPPSRIVYLWERHILRRIELFTAEDLAKKPEIPRDTDKLPPIPTESSRRKKWMKITDEKEKKRHHGPIN